MGAAIDLTIRTARPADHDMIWQIMHPVIAAGDTYTFDPQTSREEALAYWFHPGTHPFVAEREGRVVGTYILKPNQPGLGSHVANAAFMVLPLARGLGLGRRMGEHCLAEARRLGFLSMQFNFVVSTNEPAVRLWKQLGFTIVGTLPQAFRHPTLGRVDAYVMFRHLDRSKLNPDIL
jgi:GNAT superfamily N-acetyltransferase